MDNYLQLFDRLAREILSEEKQLPVAPYISTDNIYQTLDLSLDKEPILDEVLERLLKDVIKHTPKTASKAFFNQLFGGRISKATLGELLSVMLNNSMYTYKVAGPQAAIEKVVIDAICNLVGYPDGGGSIAAGGSSCNMMAMIMARDYILPEIRQQGVQQKMIVYTSVASHYSIVKNASFIGIGRNQVREIDTDNVGQMHAKSLDDQIRKDLDSGCLPFMVNATSGTTVLGAFDDLKSISRVCKKYKIWMHVDGAYSGSVIFSKQYRHLVDGLSEADSFSLNAHKMLGTPLTCSILVSPHKAQLSQSFSNEATYLYQTNDDDFDLGKTSMQCGRRNDALKLWTLWKSIGTSGIERIVNHHFALADVARAYIRSHSDYTLYSFDDSVSICFNYKNIPAKTLCNELYKHSQLMVGFGKYAETEFIRMVTINSVLTKEDILSFFKIIESFPKKNLL